MRVIGFHEIYKRCGRYLDISGEVRDVKDVGDLKVVFFINNFYVFKYLDNEI